MKTTTGMVAALLCVVAPTLVIAQDFSGAVTLGYGSSDVEGISEDLSTLSLNGRAGVDFGNGFRLGIDHGVQSIDIDGVAEDVSIVAMGIYGAYRFNNGMSLGGYAEKAKLDVDALATDLSATSYGLMGGYSAGAAHLSGFFGKTTTDPDLPAGVDIRDIGLAVKYAAAPNLTLGASAMRSRISDSVTDLDVDFIGLAGAYGVAENWSLFGGLSRASLDLVDADVTSFGVGVSYDLSSHLRMGSSVSLELARSNASVAGVDGDLDTVRLGLSIPLGGDGFSVPMNSVADSVMAPRHNAITSAVMSAF